MTTSNAVGGGIRSVSPLPPLALKPDHLTIIIIIVFLESLRSCSLSDNIVHFRSVLLVIQCETWVQIK